MLKILESVYTFKEICPIAIKHQEQALKVFRQYEIQTLIGLLERIQNNISPNPSAGQ